MRIHLPAETWEEILNWLNRREFADKMEQLWDREFSPIAEKWLHEWSRNIKIGTLEYCKNTDTNQADLWKRGNYTSWQIVTIAEVEVPKNICSFGQIRIMYLDNTILAFLRNMRSLLHNVHLSIDYLYETELQPILDHLLPLFSGEFESVKLRNNYIYLLYDNRYSSALLNTKVLILKQQIFFPWRFELAVNWLFTKRADGQPRQLVLIYYGRYTAFMATIKERFMATNTADECFPFIIRLNKLSGHSPFYEPFEEETIENVNNGQQLIIREIVDARRNRCLLFISCPLGMDHERLAAWERDILADFDSLSIFERDFHLFSPQLGHINPIDQQLLLSGSSAEANNAQEQPETSSKALKRNAQNEEEAEEVDCGKEKKKRVRPN